MPALLNNPAHWQLRADETRLLADHLIESRGQGDHPPDEYDRLAGRALARMQRGERAKVGLLRLLIHRAGRTL
jgi:hypothetical protein